MTDHEEAVQRLMGLARIAFDPFYAAIDDRERRFESALREALQPQWLPIETAPKDECVLLLRGRGVTFVGRWGDYQRHNQPCITHWMPLPPAPQQKDSHA